MERLPPAKKKFGQNFLVNRKAIQRIVAALAARHGEPVLEIGPGRGALTADLLEAAGTVAAVELDPTLAAMLRSRFPAERLVLIEQDILELGLESVLERLGRPRDAGLAIVGNLPYNISKPVAMKLVAERAVVTRAVLMFQREVAQRLTATHGSRSYGPISVLVGEAFRVRRLFDLSPSAFRPRPAVTSSVTHWERHGEERMPPGVEARLRACLGVCFARRRKTLRNNLGAFFGERAAAEGLLAAAGLDPSLRAEQVPPAGFRELAARWPDGPHPTDPQA